MGHAWQLSELKDAGLVEKDSELVQLTFNNHDDRARKQFVDTGMWMQLGTGQIVLTQNFRPYKAVKYIKSDDSFFQVASVEELCKYPGDINPRVRWEEMTPRQIESKNYQSIRNHGQNDFTAATKQVKSQLKSPLADKQPIYALNYKTMTETKSGELVIEDSKGERILLTDQGMQEEPESLYLLRLLTKDIHTDQTLIGRFHHDLDTQQLQVKPLAVITQSDIVRLTY